jgi:hypothetical protein
MARNGVGQARAHHHEFVLAFGFHSPRGPAHGVVETAQLAARAGIHIAHAAHNDVRLVVQVKAVGNQLVNIDFGRTVTAPVAAVSALRSPATVATAITAWATAAACRTIAARRAARATTTGCALLTRRTVTFGAFFGLLFFCLSH